MKRVFLFLAFIAFSYLSFGQTLNNKPISELDVSYIEIVGTQKLLKLYEITINVNFGQVGSMREVKNSFVYDENGKQMAFNGMIDVVNFFNEYGYELKFAYPVTTSNQNVYHYIMYKPKAKKEKDKQ